MPALGSVNNGGGMRTGVATDVALEMIALFDRASAVLLRSHFSMPSALAGELRSLPRV